MTIIKGFDEISEDELMEISGKLGGCETPYSDGYNSYGSTTVRTGVSSYTTYYYEISPYGS